MHNRLLTMGSLAFAITIPALVRAQAGPPPADSEAAKLEALAKLAQNPVGNLISFPFQENASYGYGPYNRNQSVLNIQPVIPVSVGSDWNLITRTIFPIVWQPVGPSGSASGLGSVNFSAYLSPANPGKLIWGVGPTINFASTDPQLGSRQYSAGPAIVLLTQPGDWVLGIVANNTWGFAGESNGQNWNVFYSQEFVNYNIDKTGWYLTSAPIITANWAAKGGNVWTVPLGGGAGKIVKVGGKLPLNCQLSAYSYVARPVGAPNWTLRAQVAILLPKSILEG
jgi:hypothetical protein